MPPAPRSWVVHASIRAAGLVAMLAPTGCGLLFGYGDYDRASSSGSGGGGGSSQTGTGSSEATTGGPTTGSQSNTTSNGTSGTGGASDCGGGATCVDTSNVGWNVVTFVDGSGGCPSGTSVIHSGGTNPPAQPGCSQCACDSLGCTAASFQVFTANSTCGGAPAAAYSIPSNACFNQTNPPIYSAAVFPGTTSCQANGGVKQPVDWAMQAATCTAPSGAGTCDGGGCFVAPAPPAALCISQDGDLACPSPGQTKHLFYTTFLDSSFCAPCGCGGQGDVCTGTANMFFSANCQSVEGGTLTPGACLSVPGFNPQSLKTDLVPSACVPNGGGPQGSITTDTSTAVTVCCD